MALTKTLIVNELIQLGCSIPINKLRRLGKRDLETMYRSYQNKLNEAPLSPRKSRRPQPVERELSSDDDESDEDNKDINLLSENIDSLLNDIELEPVEIEKGGYNIPEEEPIERPSSPIPPEIEKPDLEQVKQEIKQQPSKGMNELRTDTNEMIKQFTNEVNKLISNYKNDNDIQYLIDTYNFMYDDIERDIVEYLETNNAPNSIFNRCDSMIQTVNNRIKRIVK
jgi:hypothetical protein